MLLLTPVICALSELVTVMMRVFPVNQPGVVSVPSHPDDGCVLSHLVDVHKCA
jgi:hypothetical protein